MTALDMTGFADLTVEFEDFKRECGEVRAQHPAADMAKLRTQYDGHPVEFIRDVLSGAPWDRQIEIAELIRDHPRVSVQSCNGAGKDWLASHLSVYFAAMGWFVIITGTSERQVRATLMDTAFSAWSTAEPRLPGEFMQMGWMPDRAKKEGILAFTATDSGRARGHHAPKLLAIITEAQGVPAEVYKGIRQCLTGPVSRFLVLGNPDKPEGDFYKICQSPEWKHVKISAYDCPNVKQNREVVPGGVDRAFIADQATAYGDQSAAYSAAVLGEFPESSAEEAVFPRALREAAYARWRAGKPETRADALGLDIGGGGDRTIVAPRCGNRIEELRVWNTPDQMQLVGRLRVEAEQWGVTPRQIIEGVGLGGEQPARGTIIVDANALGAGASDRLREEKFRVVAFLGQASAPKPTRRSAITFGNLRAAAYWRLRELMGADLALPPDPLLDEELAAMKYEKSESGGKMYMKAKDDLKKVLGRSPDRLDAVVLACWEAPRTSGLSAAGQW